MQLLIIISWLKKQNKKSVGYKFIWFYVIDLKKKRKSSFETPQIIRAPTPQII
jgi:hypothetical protein